MSKEKDVFDLVNGSGIPKSKIYEAHNKYYSYDNWTPRMVRTKDIGFCSRLLTDMADNGATEDELERAILFSIVVLDCVKKRLNIKKAFDDLGIAELRDKYMGGE